MSQYQTIKTQAGMALEAAADTGGASIKLATMSVGDGNGQPVSVSTTQTGLVHEVDRVSLNRLQQNPNDATQWVAEAVFPADRGGYTVREVGLWTESGVLFAVSNFPDTYKPAPEQGTAGQLIIQLNFRAANSDNVTLVVDGSLQLATLEQLNTESQRAQNAENNLLSGVMGVSSKDGDFRGLGWIWQGASQAPCFIFLGPDGKPVFKAVVTREQVDGWLANLASNAALNAESQRAQNAENNLLSGVMGVSSKDGDFRGLGWIWQGASQAPCFIFLGPDGKPVFKAVVTREQVDAWLANLASNAALNAESQRAQNAENNLLSGVMGVSSKDGDFRGLGWIWQGVSTAPCFIFLGPDGKPVFKAVVTREQVDAWLANLASNAALNAESQRAQNAENNLLSGVQGVNSSAGDLRGLGWFWQGVSTAPCFIFLGPDGKPVFKAVVTREQVDAWLANLASNAALNAETIRATNAENALVAKAGDTMGGSLIFDSGSPFTAWSASPQLIYRIGGGVVSLWGQVFGDRIVLLLGGNNPGQPYRNWRFDPTAGTLTSPSGNPIPEVVGFGDARVCDQAFIVRGVSQGGPDSETWVTFPVQFAAGSKPVVTLTVNRETNRTSRGVSLGNINNQNETNVTNTGFSFQPWFAIGGNINTSGQPWEIHVRVIGVM